MESLCIKPRLNHKASCLLHLLPSGNNFTNLPSSRWSLTSLFLPAFSRLHPGWPLKSTSTTSQTVAEDMIRWTFPQEPVVRTYTPVLRGRNKSTLNVRINLPGSESPYQLQKQDVLFQQGRQQTMPILWVSPLRVLNFWIFILTKNGSGNNCSGQSRVFPTGRALFCSVDSFTNRANSVRCS